MKPHRGLTSVAIIFLILFFSNLSFSAPNTLTGPGTVIEEKFETRLETPKDMHFYIRWPKTAGTVKGMLCYCTYRDSPADLLKQMQGAAQDKGNPAADCLNFADEQGLILMTWTLGDGFWDKSVSADEMEKSRAKFYDKVFDDVANVWEQSLRSLIRKYDLPKSNYLLCGHSRGAQWAHRVALRYPAYFKAVSITVNTSGGRLVKMTYDKANQLVSSERVEATPPSLGFHGKKGELTEFTYDKAGRMTREKSETLNLKPSTATYTYGYLDKVLKVDRDGQTAQFHYGADGMLLGKTKNGQTESWTWDGLALLSRGDETYVNEPHLTGGVPIIATRPKMKQTALGATKAEGDEADEILLSDYLGTTLDTLDSEETTSSLSPPPSSLGSTGLLTSYGGTSDLKSSNLESCSSSRFTGKPYDADLGAHVFPFRNYRSDTGGWTTADPSGFPDGPNQHYYAPVGTSGVDPLGLYSYSTYDLLVEGSTHIVIDDFRDALSHYRGKSGGTSSATATLIGEIKGDDSYKTKIMTNLKESLEAKSSDVPTTQQSGTISGSGFRGLECHTMGSFKADFNYNYDWQASEWNAWGVRDVTATVDIDFTFNDAWDFVTNPSYNFWQNLTREWGPGIIAGDGQAFNITGDFTESFTFTFRQIRPDQDE